MAVFTPVTLDQIIPWAAKFPIGQVRSIQGISSGIENSNFFLFTDRAEYVLTIFEKLSFEQLPFYLNLRRSLTPTAAGQVSISRKAMRQSNTSRIAPMA